ncbi:MFS transporter [Legionella feeleii]|uniref:Permease of the major facilitator superfamily n=1 Tax=Legionella feeleii TaxID=453 RepID=A0A0W0UAV4_9GAMM|nr:MFS transporter [Legionella feeleii]KTD04911.1 permease of the major facilitator superfamily protein [Legionella feeleii]SPX62187.1 permease of the major facilitator superfamily [Legionella feeleii]
MNLFIDISLLKKNRNYALLYVGQFVSFIGTMITTITLPYQIYQLTRSSLMVGLLSLVQLIPLLITALLGGVFADKYNRRSLVIISEACLVIGCALLALNAYIAQPSLTGIFVISSLMSAITGLHRPALESMSQQLVLPGDYKALGVLVSFKYSFCMIVGPAIAGFIIAHLGVVVTYCIDLLTFAISITSLFLMQNPPKPIAANSTSALAAIKEGVQFAWKRQELLGSYCVDFIAMVFAMPNALFPAIAQSLGGAQTLGLLYAAPAVGSLSISFVSGWTAKVKQDGKAIAIAAAFWGLTMVGFGLSTSLFWAFVFLALSGAFDAISGIFRSILWNHSIPHDYRGRLAGIEMISYLSGPRLGDTRAGVIASAAGITTAIVSGGFLCVAGVTLCCLCMPKFWRYQSDN